MKIKKLELQHADQFAKLHLSLIPWTSYSRAGEAVLCELYQELLSSEHYTAYGAFVDKNLIGISGLSTNSKVRSLILHIPHWERSQRCNHTQDRYRRVGRRILTVDDIQQRLDDTRLQIRPFNRVTNLQQRADITNRTQQLQAWCVGATGLAEELQRETLEVGSYVGRDW